MSYATPAKRVVYSDFLANAAAVLYTYLGNKTGYAQVSFASFCNISGGAATVDLSIVAAAGTDTDTKWKLIDDLSLATKESMWYFEDAGNDGNIAMKDGDRLVAFSNTASAIAARIVVTEHNGT